jgi:hypothetical protein
MRFAFYSDFSTYFFVGGRGIVNKLQAKNVQPFPQSPKPLHFSEMI